MIFGHLGLFWANWGKLGLFGTNGGYHWHNNNIRKMGTIIGRIEAYLGYLGTRITWFEKHQQPIK